MASSLDTSSSVWGSIGLQTPIQSLNQSLNQPQASKTEPVARPARRDPPDPAGMVGSFPPSMNSNRGSSTGSGGSGRANAAPAVAAVPYKRTGGGIQVGEHTGYLRMRGLPFSASKEDISKFFEVYNPILETIVLTYRSDGRATGEAYVGFESPEDSKRAMELHRKSMGNRYIELFLSNKEEHGRALARFGNR